MSSQVAQKLWVTWRPTAYNRQLKIGGVHLSLVVLGHNIRVLVVSVRTELNCCTSTGVGELVVMEKMTQLVHPEVLCVRVKRNTRLFHETSSQNGD